MKKRLFILLLVGLSLGACSNSHSNSNEVDKVIANETPEASKELETPEVEALVTANTPEVKIESKDEYTEPKEFKTIQTESKDASLSGDTLKSEASDKSVLINKGTTINSGVKSNGNETNALYAKNNGFVLNEGTLKGEGSGAKASGGTIVNGVNGQILTTGKYMMRAESDGTVINLGTLSNGIKDKTVLYTKGGTAINYKDGKISADNGAIGMYSEEAGSRSVNYGTITINGNKTRGMRAKGVGATIENRGTIVVNGTENRGMYVEEGASAYNYGTIDLTNSIKGRGIYAVGDKTTVENTGIIYLNTAVLDKGNNDYRDAKENRAFELKDGASLKNTGEVIVK